MHPALSVIFFTVTAGAGYGLIMMLYLARVTDLVVELSAGQVVAMGFVGLFLITAGLLSSTLHLANPKNAWRSFARFRTSWLSREAVFAVLFYPVCIVWLALEWWADSRAMALWIGAACLVLSAVILVCTAMIYASLKTIRQWNNALTPVNFVLLGLLLGTLILLLMLLQQGIAIDQLLPLTLGLLLMAAMVKLFYFAWIGQPAGPTINSALGFMRASIRLLDVGQASDTFLNKEFGFQVARSKLMWLRVACVLLIFALPFLILMGVLGEVRFLQLLLAALSAYAGVFIERWLFFAEARHVVNLYYGAQKV